MLLEFSGYCKNLNHSNKMQQFLHLQYTCITMAIGAKLVLICLRFAGSNIFISVDCKPFIQGYLIFVLCSVIIFIVLCHYHRTVSMKRHCDGKLFCVVLLYEKSLLFCCCLKWIHKYFFDQIENHSCYIRFMFFILLKMIWKLNKILFISTSLPDNLVKISAKRG